MPFYSQCPKCGYARRFLTKEESKNPQLVKENKKKPFVEEEMTFAKKVVKAHCVACAPKTKKKKIETEE